MKKATLILQIFLIVFFGTASISLAESNQDDGEITQIVLKVNNPEMYVDGELKEIDPGKDTVPIVRGGNTLLPVSSIIKELGGNTAWSSKENKLTINLNERSVVLWLDQKKAMVNSVSKTLSTAPTVIEGRTMVPLRFLSEQLGIKIVWHGSNQVISLFYSKSGVTGLWFEGNHFEKVSNTVGRYHDGGATYSIEYPLAWGNPYVIDKFYSANSTNNLYDYHTVFYSDYKTTITGDVFELEPNETPKQFMERTGRTVGEGYNSSGIVYSYADVINGKIQDADASYTFLKIDVADSNPTQGNVMEEFILFKGYSVIILKLESIAYYQKGEFDINTIPKQNEFIDKFLKSFKFEEGAGAAG
ncbi:copper amine oxidase N-terminal domain-containing protein [Paenibacillus sp. HW567]|uniref:copper amine oxidase N-terminal domain-containing protein n=1 Tax=Paenibacillus sp. HW567 TaxID=1034769 RepID=UPI000361F709|nr:stalk domain-containing protein [Paenibacillus sp. HW567]